MWNSGGRYLPRNEGNEAPSNLVFVDSESVRVPHQGDGNEYGLELRLWCASRVRLANGMATRRITGQGKSQGDFWNWLDSVSDEHRCTWVFAHNLGFDLTQLGFWSMLDAGWFTLEPLYQNSDGNGGKPKRTWVGKLCLETSPCYVVVRKGKKTYKFVDTCNYWPTSLAEIGESIGTRKMQMPLPDDSDKKWYDYCMQDVRVIEYAITALIARWIKEDCGVFQMTAASLALTNFRHTCPIRTTDGTHVDIVTVPDACYHRDEREAYYGGRVQCFYRGELADTVYHLDANSLYPAVMFRDDFPRRYSHTLNNPTVQECIGLLPVYGLVATVSVRSRHETYPMRIDGYQYHACGRFWTTLAGAELCRALQNGHIDKVHVAHVYSVAPIFRQWVNYWYGRKIQSVDGTTCNAGEREFCKMILNSLSGKFSQKTKCWRDQRGKIPPERWGGWTEYDELTMTHKNYRAIAGNQQVLEDGPEPSHSFPAISAFITAAGREVMRDYINLCPEKSVLYMATDSLIVTEEGYESLEMAGAIDPSRLGGLRVVGKHHACHIYGPNRYALDGIETCSGLRGKMLRRKNGKGTVEVFEQLPGTIARGAVHDVRVKTVVPPICHPTFRGEIDGSGYWSPYRLSLDPEFTDHPPRLGYSFDDSPDTVADRIQLHV